MTWEPKFKVGDTVQIITDLDRHQHAPGINGDMRNLQGTLTTVRRAPSMQGGYYTLENNTWSWAEDWLDYPYPEIEDIQESDFMLMFEE